MTFETSPEPKVCNMSDANRTRVHVAFGSSAAGSLKLALSTLQLREEVLELGDDLAFGPINPLDTSLRLEWGEAEVGLENDPELQADIEEFWTRLSSVPVGTDLVAWMSRRSVSEYCGFLEVLSRVDDLSVVDVADIEFVRPDGSPYPEGAKAFAAVPDAQVIAKNLIERAVRVSPSQREAYLTEWRKVRQENAALRVLTPEGLVSVPIDFGSCGIHVAPASAWCRRTKLNRGYSSVQSRRLRKTKPTVTFCVCPPPVAPTGIASTRWRAGRTVTSRRSRPLRLATRLNCFASTCRLVASVESAVGSTDSCTTQRVSTKTLSSYGYGPSVRASFRIRPRLGCTGSPMSCLRRSICLCRPRGARVGFAYPLA
jgi:hypothetical protein